MVSNKLPTLSPKVIEKLEREFDCSRIEEQKRKQTGHARREFDRLKYICLFYKMQMHVLP